MRAQQVLARLITTDLKKGLKKYGITVELTKEIRNYGKNKPYDLLVRCHPPMARPLLRGTYVAVKITPDCQCTTVRVFKDAQRYINESCFTLCEHNIADPDLTGNLIPAVLRHTNHRSTLRRPKHKRGCRHYVKGNEHRLGPPCKMCKNL